MYRLLKLRRFSVSNAQSVISQISCEAQFQTCSHCNQALFRAPNSRQFIQQNSTRFHATESSSVVVLNIPAKRKKTKKPRKKYTELLEVSEGSSLETKAKVSNLKPKEFSMLLADSLAAPIGPGGEILGDGGRCGGELGLDSELAEFDRQLEEEATRLSDHDVDQEVHEETVATPTLTLSKKGKSSKQLTAAQAHQLELEVAGRSESLTRSLVAYLDLCVSCGFLHRGLSLLLAYRGRTNRDATKICNVGPYNVLLSGFAAKGHLEKVCELMRLISEAGFCPTVASFTACFECVGRLPNEPSTRRKLQEWEGQMGKQGISLNQLFQDGVFAGDQREKVLNACERLRGPDFQPQITPPPAGYSCGLLQDLNEAPQTRLVQSRVQGLLSPEELSRLAGEQLEMEQQGSVSVTSVEHQSQPSETTLFYRGRLEEAQARWRAVVAESFQRDLQSLRVQHQNYRGYRQMTLYPFFKVLPPEQYVEIVMQEIRRLAEGSETFSPSLQLLYRDVGAKVLSRYQIQCKLQGGVVRKMERLHEEYCLWFASSDPLPTNTRTKWQQLILANPEGPTVTAQNKTWSNPILINVGKFLYNIILRDIKVDVNMLRTTSKKCHSLPAFYSLYRNQGKLVKEEVKPHPLLARLFRGAAPEKLVFNAQSVPMLCPPVPWSSVLHGGHIIANTDVIRLPYQAVQQWERMVGSPPSQLYPALDSLNQLGSVPWRINEPMLDVVTEVFRSGGSPELDIPEPPSACPPPDQLTPEMTKAERFQAYRRRLALRRKKAEMYSLWCDALYRLSLAKHFRKHIFWLPHNMDFRGRVYPCPPHLNHMGSDMARAILCFAKGEPLGPRGLDWLKIHAVNLTGLKKREGVAERLRFAEQNMPQILDSADNPLTGGRWWAESEEPWQTLACCMEIARASRSPDPATFVSHFPVHQDGSCNGLQHYAALGRDEAGAVSVNLTPAQEPQDVYSCVAALVERERSKDAAAGVKVAQVLEGFVKRKVIKQTVMTTVYGVTRYGARLQIARQLKDIDKFPRDFVWQSSTYLVGKTFESLREMFTSTKEIQDWFTESARLISQVRGQNVEWVTPLGLPIVQPYSRNKKADSSQSSRKLHEHYNMDMFDRPNVMKQKNAFPPNFIHSLDSSHMMLTSLFCEQQGITFVSVHDCFWTHPSTVHVMNKVCREQFVALHKQPILEDLSRHLVERYSFDSLDIKDNSSIEGAKRKLNLVLTQVPPRGRFDLSQVLNSIYFFS